MGPYLFSIGGYFLPFFMLSGAFSILSLFIFVSGVLDGEENNRKVSGEENNRKVSGEEPVNCIEQQLLDNSVKPMPDFKFIMSIPVSIVILTQ
jgi:hypothetical protein